MTFDAHSVRRAFPALAQSIHGKPLVYLDSAATTQKPRVVLDAITRYYETSNANVHRGVHALSERATALYEGARKKLQAYLGAASEREIVFVRGATEAINLVAQSLRLAPGDEILITHMEHHSNIVPWQMACQRAGAVLKAAPLTPAGELQLDAFQRLLGPRTKLVAFTHVSNALGTVNPVTKLVAAAKTQGALVLIDGAQAMAHLRVDVRALGCDFYVLSGHKMYGPTGIGVLYGKEAVLEALPPWQGGGDMIKRVTIEATTYNDLPYRFEAGTPHISGAVGLGAAVDFLSGLDFQALAAHEARLLASASKRLAELPHIRLVGAPRERAAVLPFVHETVHPHDIGTILDSEGVAVRTGHHCAQPVMDHFGIAASVRLSLGVYSTEEDINALVSALGRVERVFT